MNAIVRLVMVFVTGAVIRTGFRWFVMGSPASAGGGDVAAQPGFAQTHIAPLFGQVLGVQITPMQAGALAVGTLVYALIVGFVARTLFGAHVFGSRINGVIALLGAWGAIALYALVVGQGSPDQLQYVIVAALMGSVAALAAAGVLKAFIAGEFDTFMRGGQTKIGATVRKVNLSAPSLRVPAIAPRSGGPSGDRLRAAVSRAQR